MTTFEMTGFVTCKSKDREIRFKEDFVKWMKQWNWVHHKIDRYPEYLVYSRQNTIKWTKAQRMGIKCITYEEALDMVEKIEIFNII